MPFKQKGRRHILRQRHRLTNWRDYAALLLVQILERGHIARKGAVRERAFLCRALMNFSKVAISSGKLCILCVRWYLRFKLSFRDLVEMMAERGIDLAHTTIMRWIQRYVPEFEKRWNRFASRQAVHDASTKLT